MTMINITTQSVTIFQYRDMREWCRTNIGTESWWGHNFYRGHWYAISAGDNLGPGKMMKWCGPTYFTFQHQKDCAMFCLKFL